MITKTTFPIIEWGTKVGTKTEYRLFGKLLFVKVRFDSKEYAKQMGLYHLL